MHDVERALQEQQDLAAERFREREGDRAEKIRALQRPGGILEADTPERIAKRLDRLVRYRAGEELPLSPADVPDAEYAQVVEAALERARVPVVAGLVSAIPAEPQEAAGVVLERIINSEDFVDIRYLEAGVAAARAVCRVNIRNEAGRLAGYGSGSLVSPQLVLTNHHVFPSARVAAVSALEFNYQDGLDGQPLRPRVFRLDPDRFFLADRERDFALVAVRASEQVLATFGFNRLIEAEGKAVIGEFVTIVQHPRGQKKQVALRENRIVDLLEHFLHYEADTEPGSSGSPVFNDQWEIVALHHASVRARDREEFGGYLNEGVRISRILKFVRAQGLSSTRRALADQLFEPEQIVLPAAAEPVEDDDAGTTAPAEHATKITVPIEITVRVRTETVDDVEEAEEEDEAEEEAIRIDPQYGRRRGYNPNFLGRSHRVPLPTLPDDLLAKASRKESSAGGGRHVLT